MAVLQIGDQAPDFELPAVVAGVKKRFHLSEHAGSHNILLAFYPFNWESVAREQMVLFQKERARFAAHLTQVVAISVESIMNTAVWERSIGPLDFTLCSDFWPHGKVARHYGVLQEDGAGAGACQHAIFLVDRAGRIASRTICSAGEVPDIEGILRALEQPAA
jgi:peroxiredoxin